MKKDNLFISYSRQDLQQVESFVKMIERRANVKCWIDWNGIESGEQFEDVIVSAIDSVDVVLFFISENSMNSTYAKMEVNYAYNIEKKVVPIVLDGGKLRGWFLFKFGSVDFIDINNQQQCDKLIRNLQAWCGTTSPEEDTISIKTYKIGDYYNDGVREGVVFEVTADGCHGKIVSMKQSTSSLEWSSDENEQRRLIGATSKTDGATNMAKVKAVSDWQNKYPAFAWCADLGEGWYLPAIWELEQFMLNKQVHDAVNRTLKAKKGNKLYNRAKNTGWYWSSTEENFQYSTGEFCAWFIDMDGSLAHYDDKFLDIYVRAVATF